MKNLIAVILGTLLAYNAVADEPAPLPAKYLAEIVVTNGQGQVIDAAFIGATSDIAKCLNGLHKSFAANPELIQKITSQGATISGYCVDLAAPQEQRQSSGKDESTDPRLTPEQAEKPRLGA